MSIAIHCEGLTKSYHTGGTVTPALRGIDLEVNEGELFMLVGPSGCGKTTLISVIAAILNHDEGECSVLGRDVKKLNDSEKTSFRSQSIGFVFQSYNLIPTLSATENVSIPLLLNGFSRSEANRKAEEMLGRVGLADKLNSLPLALSGGQQQRVAIARAIVHNPRIIVCDEPTSALDHATGAEVMEVFKREALEGKRTLVIVTHDSRIYGYANRIGLMDDGRILKVTQSPSEILDSTEQ